MRIFLLFLFLYSCSHPASLGEDEKIAAKIRGRVFQTLKKEIGLVPFGFGCNGGKEKLNFLELAFQYYRPVEIEEGRRLLVRATEEFLHEINADEKIRPYLQNYPFEPKNVNILIVVRKPDGRKVDKEELALIEVKKGNLEYDTYDPAHYELTTIHRETYEEALRALQNPV